MKFCNYNILYTLPHLLIFQSVFVSIVNCAVYSQNPKVRLSACQFGNRKYDSLCSGKNTSVQNLEIPKTFRQLEFTCSASYPTEWVFRDPLVNEINVISVNITKSRISGDYPSQDTFESVLVFKFKYSTNIPNFACNSVFPALHFATKNAEVDEYSNSPSWAADKYFSTNITSISTEDSITLKIFFRLSTNRRKQSTRNTSDLCKYQIQFVERRNVFRCTIPNSYSVHPVLPVQFIASSSLDESNQQFSPDAYSCSQRNSLDRTTLYNLQNFTGSGIITCGKDPALVVKHYYFPMHSKTIDFLSSKEINVSNSSEVFKGQDVEFICRVPSFFFSKGIKWCYSLNDSSSSSCNSSCMSLNDTSNEYYEEGEIVSKIMIHFDPNFTTDTVGITCQAPVANSIAWVNNTVQVVLKEGQVPEIPSVTIETVEEKKTSYLKFTCKSRGKPNPNFVWILEGINFTELTKLSSRLKHNCKVIRNCLKISTNGSTSVLRLERTGQNKDWEVKKTNVTCLAINIFGTTQTTVFNSKFSNFHITIISIAVGVCLVLTLIIGCAYYKVRSIRELTDAEIDRFVKGEPSSKDPTLLPYDTRYEIPRKNFQIANTVLGQGFSGMVKIGKYGSKIVAVKTVKTPTDSTYFQALLKELKMLCYLGSHENIINLIGSCTENIRKKEVYILLEFCSNGSMLEYMKGYRHNFVNRYAKESRESYVLYQNGCNKNMSTRDLLRWASEVADGCSFLSARKVIHGDLAARNVLITDSLLAKVSDFGLSKEILDYSIYVRKEDCPLPLKWMAIESLQDFEFSIESDVWAFGVTLWEIFSLGDVPYPGIDWNYDSYKLLSSGFRMEKPKYASNKIYDIMMLCWNEKPKLRPSFSYLRDFFLHERKML